MLFDDDIVEVTNLQPASRCAPGRRGAMRPKVMSLRERSRSWVLAPVSSHCAAGSAIPGAVTPLKACDVIFGCTDDHDGRLMLNRLAYFYLIRVIDMGLAIDPAPDGVAFAT